jgi:hypothetical protein
MPAAVEASSCRARRLNIIYRKQGQDNQVATVISLSRKPRNVEVIDKAADCVSRQ